MIIKEYNDYDDYDPNEYGATSYDAKAYYSKWCGLANSEKFSNIYDLRDWISDMVQSGFYVSVYDYEDGDYRYYAWPENPEDFDITDVDELEIDENGNFYYIDAKV